MQWMIWSVQCAACGNPEEAAVYPGVLLGGGEALAGFLDDKEICKGGKELTVLPAARTSV